MELRPYDYKIYVTGPFQSGKTTFIHTLDPNTVSVERPLSEPYRGEMGSTTTAFDLGRVVWAYKNPGATGLLMPAKEYQEEKDQYDGWIIHRVEVRGAPGQLHFRTIREVMMVNAHGVLMLVDASDPGKIGEACAILAETKDKLGGIPLTVLANKQDRQDAADPEAVAEWLGVEKVHGMTGKDIVSASDVMIRLLLEVVGARPRSGESSSAQDEAVTYTAHLE
ncbi:MAG: ADP-ribosylation factor-like protein [Promethearchaeota archaeon]